MTKIYTTDRTAKSWRKLALLGLLGLATGAAHAQAPLKAKAFTGEKISVKRHTTVSTDQHRTDAISYPLNQAVNTKTTYTDLGSSGTLITTANFDDANSALQDIGFSFSYNGTAYTQFVLNTNGLIKLGATGIADPKDINALINKADLNVIAPASGVDLTGAADQTANPTTYRISTTGTAGSRVCTIQFKNLADKADDESDAQFATMQFQIKLYEATSIVEFVYGSWTSTTKPATLRYFYVGLKGSSNAIADLALAAKLDPSSAWSATVFQNTVTQGENVYYAPHFADNAALPDAGRTYRFRKVTLPANDVAVKSIFTLGQVSREFNSPHTVQAVITNNSAGTLTNIPVTLTVSGPNTFTNVQTVASLGSEQSTTVTFAAYPLTSTGTNTVQVTVPADNVNTNNSAVASQNVSTNRLSYIDPNVAFSAGGVGVGQAEGILAAKFSITKPTTVYTVKPTFAPSGSTDNVSPYQILLLDATGTNGTPGAILYTSPTQTRPAAGGTVTVAVPNIAVSADFYIGVKELNTNPGLASQLEDPLRPNTFFYKTATGAWTSLNATTLRTRLALEAGLGTAAACDVPTALTVTSPSPTTATVTFTGAAGATGYSIIYGPTGFNPATGGTTVAATASPFTITGLTGSTTYDVYIRTNCSASSQSDLVGPVKVTTACQPPIISTFPYTENFDGVAAGALPCGITVDNTNADDQTWRVGTSFANGDNNIPVANSGPNAIYYRYNSDNAANDWFFTPALFLRVGTTYQLAFKYRTFDSKYPEKLEVKYGSANTPAGQTTTIWNNDNIISGAAGYQTTGAGGVPAVTVITPTTTGNYYIGFHAFTDKDQYVLAVDDISVTATAVTASSSALQQAINLYPNPTAGNLTVDVRGANAKNGLQVEVTNMLGQRVHTETVRDNAVKVINLSNLANGMYTVKVRNGAEYMVRTISVQK